MRWIGIAAGLAAACGSSGPASDATVCKQMRTLCQDHATLTCLTADDWRDMRRDLGAAPVDTFRGCVASARQCTALTACVIELGADAVRKLDDRQLDKLGLRDPAPTPPDADRPAVRFDTVTVRTAPTAFGHELSVSIELTVTGPMPHVAPEVTVEAACGGATDKGDAFFSSLGAARVGDRRSDTIKLFDGPGLDAAPASCDLTLGLSAGATSPAHYCFRAGATTAGACAP